jgi:hypothetical protein
MPRFGSKMPGFRLPKSSAGMKGGLLLMPARDQLEAVQITSYLVTLGFLTQCLVLFAYLPYFRFHCHSCNSRLKSPLGAIRVSNAICWMVGVLDDGEAGNGKRACTKALKV